MADTRKKYTRELKVEAVRMRESGEKTCLQIETELAVGSGQVYRWRKELETEGGSIRAFPGNAASVENVSGSWCDLTAAPTSGLKIVQRAAA